MKKTWLIVIGLFYVLQAPWNAIDGLRDKLHPGAFLFPTLLGLAVGSACILYGIKAREDGPGMTRILRGMAVIVIASLPLHWVIWTNPKSGAVGPGMLYFLGLVVGVPMAIAGVIEAWKNRDRN